MVSSALIQIVLYTTIVAQIGLILLLLSSRRYALERWVILLLAATCAVWAIGQLLFLLQTDDVTFATAVVKSYYINGAFIGGLLVILVHLLPRRRPIPIYIKTGLVLFISVITAIVLLPNGMIESVTLSDKYNTVTLNTALYLVYVAFFTLVSSLTIALFIKGYRAALRARQKHVAAQTRTMMIGVITALAFGVWFNILLPFFGDYRYIWAGPPFTLLFVIAMFYAIIAQGLFDLRSALARSSAYLLLLLTMVASYVVIVYTISNVFFDHDSQRGALVTYVILALFFTITYPSIKRFFDQLTYRLFYHDDYNLKQSLAEITTITSEEIQLAKLVKRALGALEECLAPTYISAYVVDDKGRVRHFTIGPDPPTPYQRRLQIDIVGTLLDRLPRVVNAHDSHVLHETGAQQRIRRTDVSMLLQFVVQHEHIGALFLGDKQNGMSYNEKDLQLLTTTTDELALAIQNSQRFEEIEHFNDTLQSRVNSATTRLRHSNQELKKLDRAKDEFVSLASHQLRTPLTSIKGYLSMVLEGDMGKITTNQRQVLEQAYASSERMVHLIGDFLSVSRLQTDRFTIELEPTDLNRVIEQIVASLQPIAAEHAVKLSYEGVVNKRLLMLDAAKIQQVVMNYIDNAIYYSPRDGRVTVSLEYRHHEAIMTVTDTGIGVPEAEQEGLFSKFYRAGNARKKRPDGTGVGLYLVKKIVTAHDGSIIFHSREGKGSTFGFRLPIIEPETRG
jgi:signal transduction histidine kinase